MKLRVKATGGRKPTENGLQKLRGTLLTFGRTLWKSWISLTSEKTVFRSG